jgi:SPP1 family predicted phage head-tail adaptor
MTANLVGSLRHRVTLEAPTRTDGEGGTAVVSWSTVGAMFARIRPTSGREIVAADGSSARVTHEVLIRHTSDIAPTMRFVEGTRVLEIHAVLDVEGRRRWLKCLCEERLP